MKIQTIINKIDKLTERQKQILSLIQFYEKQKEQDNKTQQQVINNYNIQLQKTINSIFKYKQLLQSNSI